MINTVFTKTYNNLPFNKKEILRYAGVKGNVPEIDALLDECLIEIKDKLTYKVCYREFDIEINGTDIDLGFARVNSKDLGKNLKDCKSIVLFAATIGIGIDRLIARHSAISPSKALMFQAIGAERIETLCDAFNDEISAERNTRPRFSPGYGDLPLEMQRDMFATLDCPRKIGLTLNESMLMSPSKSVTAIIGIC